jgi:hypothetical protein
MAAAVRLAGTRLQISGLTGVRSQIEFEMPEERPRAFLPLIARRFQMWINL